MASGSQPVRLSCPHKIVAFSWPPWLIAVFLVPEMHQGVLFKNAMWILNGGPTPLQPSLSPPTPSGEGSSSIVVWRDTWTPLLSHTPKRTPTLLKCEGLVKTCRLGKGAAPSLVHKAWQFQGLVAQDAAAPGQSTAETRPRGLLSVWARA